MRTIILGAGMGKRLQSEAFNMPKVLRTIDGKPLIGYVLESVGFIREEDTCIVVGYKKEAVMDTIKGNYNFAVQSEQLGTGHAVMAAESYMKDYDGDVLVLYGDMPLYTGSTMKKLIRCHSESGAKCTLLTAVVDNPPDYGRVIRDGLGNIVDIVEKKDCTPEQLRIKEINVGVYVFDSRVLFDSLKLLKNNNVQKEYYLTDVPKILIQRGIKVSSCEVDDVDEIYGVNTIEDLQMCRNILKARCSSK